LDEEKSKKFAVWPKKMVSAQHKNAQFAVAATQCTCRKECNK
jgi:hypothetical protein